MQTGFYIYMSDRNNLTNNNASDNAGDGFWFDYSDLNTLTDDTAT